MAHVEPEAFADRELRRVFIAATLAEALRAEKVLTERRGGETAWSHASGLYNNASEVIRESLRLLKEHDEIRVKWREQIERGWLDAQAGRVVDGRKAMADARTRLKNRAKKRA